MNSETLVQFMQRGWRVTLGATASFIEALQDPLRREENFSKLRSDLSQLTEEWEAKGETTERQARSFVDTILSQQASYNGSSGPAPSSAPSGSTVTAPASPSTSTASPDIQRDLQELTAQIAAIRSELERLQQDS